MAFYALWLFWMLFIACMVMQVVILIEDDHSEDRDLIKWWIGSLMMGIVGTALAAYTHWFIAFSEVVTLTVAVSLTGRLAYWWDEKTGNAGSDWLSAGLVLIIGIVLTVGLWKMNFKEFPVDPTHSITEDHIMNRRVYWRQSPNMLFAEPTRTEPIISFGRKK